MLDTTRQEIIPRASVESIVAHRNRAMSLYGKAHEALIAAADAIAAANEAGRMAAPRVNSFNHNNEESRKTLLEGVKVPDRPDYLEQVRRVTDTSVWSHIIEMTDLEMLMDKKAKDEFRKQLQDNPPEATVENIYATLEQTFGDAGTIFRRGLANVFSALDRRFRSHDGWKIGSRIILDHAFSENGYWNYHRNHEDTFTDVERTFLLLDGKKMPAGYVGIVAMLRDRRRGWGAQQTFVENDYFKIRCWKNGNAHIWFKRDDLLEQVNKLLAEYYGEVIPEDRDPDPDTGFHNPKTALAKNYGFFPTPDDAADRLFHDIGFYRQDGEPPLTVLEPHAGTGQLARRAVEHGATVDCIEVHPDRAADLRLSRRYRKVTCGDFLAIQPDEANLYDIAILNPPFNMGRDIDHVLHALRFLKPDGMLHAIMSAGTEFRETKKAIAFRDLMKKMHARWSDLPAGSFSSVGTNVNTIILRVRKDGRSFY